MKVRVDGIDWNMYRNLNICHVLGESGIYEAECHRKVVSERKVAGTIRSLVNTRGLQLDCARVLHETLLVPVIMRGNETMIWKGRERSRIRAVRV